MSVQHVQNIWSPGDGRSGDGAATDVAGAERAATDEGRRAARWAARVRGPALGVAQVVLAGLFVVVGVAKLVGAPAMLAAFGTIENVTGLGAWLRLLTGALEVAGGALLLVRAVAGVGAVLLGTVMAGAVLAHLFVLRSAPTAPVVLGAALAGVAYAHRDRLAVVAAQLERNL
ncbi:hypothetical protein tb265_39580 [Gemmatimonadetes bacterium T265]|nr:hypothetical protein tb265_39580 [Gemmatimonadetes bacterium T265]